ncbi:MAG: methionine adenosyltransferase [Kiritimatiellia bacterium]|jgi:S-adenosylmethionine synthetase
MSKLNTRHVFTSESVSEGHPDKVCDQISDAILDACLALDPDAHVACETAVGPDFVVNLGEFKCRCRDQINTEGIARQVVRDIGYDRPEERFSWDTFVYQTVQHAQSTDIDMGVSRGGDADQGAGDQGMMFGYASNATPELMPAPILLAHRLLARLTDARKNGVVAYLRPDAKSQVSVLHENGAPVRITDIVISNQTLDVPIERIRKDIEAFVREVLQDTGLVDNDTQFHINPTGKFVIGGPCGDAGLTGRKIIVDTYGGVGGHGGGAFSGKDPSKVDRSAAYYARYAAKNIVAAGLADKCEIQVAYAIGVARPLSINVSCFGTGKVEEARIADLLMANEIFDFRPGMLIRELGLKQPAGWSYRQTANGGHFGRPEFPWERTDKADALRSALI